MPIIILHNLPAETRRALELRAVQNGRSTEAEIRAILEDAVRPAPGLRIGSTLAAFGEVLDGNELKLHRDRTPFDPASFD